MERRTFARALILLELYLTSVCGGSPTCMPRTDPAGLYTVNGLLGSMWFDGAPSGTRVQVSVRCDQGAIAQPPVETQCFNGTWQQPWPRCERPCLVPRARPNSKIVLQFVNGLETMPISRHPSLTLQDGTRIVARCSDPGKFRLTGDQYRTCYAGEWTGEEPQCNSVDTKVLFYGAKRQVSSNGTVIVFVYDGSPRFLDVVCKTAKWRHVNPRMTTPLANDSELVHWHRGWSHRKRLDPISIEYSGIFTCSWSTLSHSVHVLFKAAECEAPSAPEHGRLQDSYRTIPRAIFPSGSTVSFGCDEDFRLVGSRMVKCQRSQWTDVSPMCIVNRCPELYVPTHAVMLGVYGIGRNIGDERIFHCYQGYILRGETNNLRCMEDGNWSHSLPTCEAIVIHTSPCDGVRCASWERCVVTGPDTARCGCINPSSCLTRGPRVCGTNGVYYTSECHMRALACLLSLQLDIADSDDVCIYGISDEGVKPTQVTAGIENPRPAVYDSSSSFVDIIYEDFTPPLPSSPSQIDEEDPDSVSFLSSSLLLNDPNRNDEEIVEETTHQRPSDRPTRETATSIISHEESGTTNPNPAQTKSTGVQTSQTFNRTTSTQSTGMQTVTSQTSSRSTPTQSTGLQTSKTSSRSTPTQSTGLQTSKTSSRSTPTQSTGLQTSQTSSRSTPTQSTGLQTSQTSSRSTPTQSTGLQTSQTSSRSTPTQSTGLQTS